MFAQGNQATSNEPIIKWNCLRSYGSRGGRVGQSGWARHPPPVFVATIMLIYLPVLSLLLSFSLVSVNHGSRLHSRRQFAGHTKRVDNLKGKSSLLTEEGHGTANARAFSCSVEHNASRWTRRAPRYRFRSVGGAHIITWTHGLLTLVLRPYISLPHASLLFLPFSFRPPVCPSLNSRMLLGFAHWKHKSYARQSQVNKPLKEPPFFSIFGLLLSQCFICLRYGIFFLRICKLFFFFNSP